MNPSDPSDWVLKGDRDLGLARHAFSSSQEFPDLICYHCQQAAEKYLKAALIHAGIPLRKTHDLEMLLDMLAEIGVPVTDSYYEAARKINEYGIGIRYPQPGEDPSLSDVEEAIEAAVLFQAFTVQLMATE